jgi:hypothetical protein
MRAWIVRGVGIAGLGFVAACAVGAGEGTGGGDDAFSSVTATLMTFDFDGELTSTQSTNVTGQIRAQMLYTVGQFNGEGGVARLDKIKLTSVAGAWIGGGLYRVRYHATLPVAWPSKTSLPSSYALTLPHRIDASGQATFLSRYSKTCNDGEVDSITSSNYWYHYRPRASACAIAASDALNANARVSVSPLNTSGKYPEYDRVWEDGALNVVAVFGKYAVGDTTEDDAGIAGYDQFIAAVRTELGDGASTSPATIPDGPGVAAPDITFTITRDDGRTITVTALLVDEVASAPTSFVKRYGELVPGADLVLYNGHAGLGANVRALAGMGKFFPGKYQVFFMNGCDTFAYMDNAIGAAHAGVNPDDPTETKYMDVITNSMPAYFSSMPDDAMSLIRAAMASADGDYQTYDAIFASVDPSQVVVVTGEEDNVFEPGAPMPSPVMALAEQDVVTKGQMIAYTTDVLPAGAYVFQLTPNQGMKGGDADLRVHTGTLPAPAPSLTNKCPSYVANSDERCVITLTSPAKIFATVTGDSLATPAGFVLRAFARH